jgi:hypothetical protein
MSSPGPPELPPARSAPSRPEVPPLLEPLTVELSNNFIHVLPHRAMLECDVEDLFDVEFGWKKSKETVRAHSYMLSSRWPILLDEKTFFNAAGMSGRMRRFKEAKNCPFSPATLRETLMFLYCGSLSPSVAASVLAELADICDRNVLQPALQFEIELALRRILTVQVCVCVFSKVVCFTVCFCSKTMHSLVPVFLRPPGCGPCVSHLWLLVQTFVFRNWQLFTEDRVAGHPKKKVDCCVDFFSCRQSSGTRCRSGSLFLFVLCGVFISNNVCFLFAATFCSSSGRLCSSSSSCCLSQHARRRRGSPAPRLLPRSLCHARWHRLRPCRRGRNGD